MNQEKKKRNLKKLRNIPLITIWRNVCSRLLFVWRKLNKEKNKQTIQGQFIWSMDTITKHLHICNIFTKIKKGISFKIKINGKHPLLFE